MLMRVKSFSASLNIGMQNGAVIQVQVLAGVHSGLGLIVVGIGSAFETQSNASREDYMGLIDLGLPIYFYLRMIRA